MWIQCYNPLNNIFLSALAAALPLALLLYLLGVRQTKGHFAAAIGLSATALLAVLIWQMPPLTAASSILYGSAYGLFPIVWIIATALWLFNMTVEAGTFETIKASLTAVTDDRRLQAIFIAFAFGSFIEGTAGFGAPVAITAAMLVGLGFKPLYAAGICLIANTAPVAFAAVGVPIIVAAQVSSLDVMKIGQTVGRQLPILALIVPLWLTITMCGLRRALEVWPALLVSGACFAGAQFFTANYINPYLPGITAALSTIAGLLILLRFWQPASVWKFPDEEVAANNAVIPKLHTADILRAWAPFIILAVLIFLWADDRYIGFKPHLLALEKSLPFYSFGWPLLDAVIQRLPPITTAPAPYPAVYTFNLLSASGTAAFLSGLLSVFFLPDYGFRRAFMCLARTFRLLTFPIVTICMILGLAYLMNYSGMSSTLGIAFTATGAFFPFFSPILGWLGVFLTGSDTSANALFGSMQKTTAEQVGVNPYLTVAANSDGGVTGKMISPQSIAVATAATGLVGKEGALFRFTLKHSLAMLFIIACLTLAQAYVWAWMIPR